MRKLDGFHTLWTEPFFCRTGETEYRMEDYELLTMVLSALMWTKENGSIAIYGDERAIDYLDKKGLLHLWSGGTRVIRTASDIQPNVFWAAGKLYALSSATAPVAMVDLDLIVWKDIRDYIMAADVCAIHREGLNPDVYPDRSFFRMKDGYRFDPEWSWDIPPVNTCLLYMADEEFKRYYVDSAVRFMENAAETEDNLRYMVFAEQRLLAMCAGAKGKRIATFFPEAADIERQNVFTHLWGYKNILKYNFERRMEFNRKLADRIIKDFPEEEETVRRLRPAMK